MLETFLWDYGSCWLHRARPAVLFYALSCCESPLLSHIKCVLLDSDPVIGKATQWHEHKYECVMTSHTAGRWKNCGHEIMRMVRNNIVCAYSSLSCEDVRPSVIFFCCSPSTSRVDMLCIAFFNYTEWLSFFITNYLFIYRALTHSLDVFLYCTILKTLETAVHENHRSPAETLHHGQNNRDHIFSSVPRLIGICVILCTATT